MFGAPRREAPTWLLLAFGRMNTSVPTHGPAAAAEQFSVSGTEPRRVIVATGCTIEIGGATGATVGGVTGTGGLKYSQPARFAFGSGVRSVSVPVPQSIAPVIAGSETVSSRSPVLTYRDLTYLLGHTAPCASASLQPYCAFSVALVSEMTYESPITAIVTLFTSPGAAA